MKNQATKIPRSNSLWHVDLDQLEREPAYLRKRVAISYNGQVITVSREVRSA